MNNAVFCNDPRCERSRKGEVHPLHDTSEYNIKRLESIKDLISAGSEMAGIPIGAAIGFIAAGQEGGIIGGIAGSLVGHTIKNIGNEVAKRILSPREQKRIGKVIIYAANRLQQYIDNEITIRQDDFFTSSTFDRSSGEEIVEATLLAAQREYEERKIEFYGNLLAGIAVSPGHSRSYANLLIRIAGELSYRQLCLLSLFAQKDKFNLKESDYRQENTMSVDKIGLLQEVFKLEQMSLLNSGNVLFGLTNITPAKMNVEGVGQALFKLMDLSKIRSDDLEVLAQLLR